MLQKSQVLGRARPDKRKSGAELSVGASTRLKRREAFREEEQQKLLDPRVESQENEAHSAFLDNAEQELSSQKSNIQSPKRPSSSPEDLDNELDAMSARRALNANKKSRKTLFGKLTEQDESEVHPAPARAVSSVSSAADAFVATRNSSVAASKPKPAEAAQEEIVALWNPVMPVIGSPTRMRRTQSVSSENLQSPKVTRENNSASVVKDFTPVKVHEARSKVADKEKGVNKAAASGVIRSPSQRQYMFKPITKTSTVVNKINLNVSLVESINEIIAGNLYRLYLGKDKAPAIGLCTSNLTQEHFIGVSSAMFPSFNDLSKGPLKRNEKPDGYEAVMVTSLFLGDTDPNRTNLGFNENNELSKIDHGRAFLASFNCGKDFLKYLYELCGTFRYPYPLSYHAIAEQLTIIRDLGWENIERRVSDAFVQLEQAISPFHSLPFYFLKHNPKRWVDPLTWASLLIYPHVEVVKVDSWEIYKQHITSMLHNNFSVIEDALACLSQAQRSDAEMQIYPMPMPTPGHIRVRKDFLVETGVIDKGVVFPVQGLDLPFIREELLNKEKLMSCVREHSPQEMVVIIEAINAKRKPEDNKILDAEGLLMEMGLLFKRTPPPPPVIKREQSVTVAYMPKAAVVIPPAAGRLKSTHASAPHIVSYKSNVEKLNAEKFLPPSEMKRD
jgi:hypothetical protein